MNDIIQQLEKSTAPNREIDKEIGELVIASEQYKSIVPHGNAGDYCIRYYPGPPGPEYLRLPRYTASIDAAMTLIPHGCDWTIEPDGAWVRWMGKDDVEEAQGHLGQCGGECTAIAICIAALKARAAEQDNGL